MRRIVVRVAVLTFAMSALAALVLHGCGSPRAQTVADTTTAATPASTSASASAEPQEEEQPAFLGATKAAVPIRPRKTK